VAEPPDSVSVGEHDAFLTDETVSSLTVDTQNYTRYERNCCSELGINKLTCCNIFLAFLNGHAATFRIQTSFYAAKDT